MRAIILNHSEQHSLSSMARPSSWALLLLGAIMLIGALWAMLHIKQRNAQLQSAIAARQTQQLPKRQSLAVPDARSEAVKNAISNIVIPWASLLKALETANRDDVKMLSLEPNAKTGTVKLNLLALNQAGMWAYVESLKMQRMLQEVRLVSNESVEINGAPALAFWVEAKWQS